MLLGYLKKKFKHIVIFDAEFRQDIKDKGEIPTVVCIVYKDIVTDKIHKASGSTINEHPYPLDETLFVAFNFIAEASSMISLGMPLPKFAYDCYIENKKLYLGKIQKIPGAFGLIRTAARYKVPDLMSVSLKDYYHDLIINNKTYTPKLLDKIIKYCQRDVEATEALFIAQLKDIEKHYPNEGPHTLISQANFHAKAMMYVAKVECNGMPIDLPLLTKIKNNFPFVKEALIKEINSKIDVYDEDLSLNHKKFTKFIKRIGLLPRWPRTETGMLSTKEKIIFNFAQENKDVDEFYFCDEFVNSQKLKGYVVGPDKRARTNLNMFGTSSGRANPSTSRNPFNASKYMRNILKPDPDHAYIYADYVQQEPGIAAWLSNDQNMIDGYNSKDMYLHVPIKANILPTSATQDTHPKERELYKRALLATMYGQKEKSLSQSLNISIDHAAKLLSDIYSSYPKYFKWVAGVVSNSLRRGYMKTKFGWRRNLDYGDTINHRSLYNFPCQAHGGDMLRLALILLTEKKFEINTLIHDGILLHVPRKKLEIKVLKIKKLMVDAAKITLGKESKIRVDIKIIHNNFEQEATEQIKFNRIMNKINEDVSVRNIGRVCTANYAPGLSSIMSS